MDLFDKSADLVKISIFFHINNENLGISNSIQTFYTAFYISIQAKIF